MKLLDEKKFLEELGKEIGFTLTIEGDAATLVHVYNVKKLTSKHTKDLPKKKESIGADPKNAMLKIGELEGYNQCLEDCEVK